LLAQREGLEREIGREIGARIVALGRDDHHCFTTVLDDPLRTASIPVAMLPSSRLPSPSGWTDTAPGPTQVGRVRQVTLGRAHQDRS